MHDGQRRFAGTCKFAGRELHWRTCWLVVGVPSQTVSAKQHGLATAGISSVWNLSGRESALLPQGLLGLAACGSHPHNAHW